MTTVRTVGHGTLIAEALAGLLTGSGVAHVVDVRSSPGSRRHPHVAREALARWLPEGGVAYSWVPGLGGRRRPVPGSPHVALRHPGFRAYADHMATEEFATGVDELLAVAEGHDDGAVAVMCAESLWWRCHRRLLADALVLLRGTAVEHVMHDGRQVPHRPTEGVRMAGDHLCYDGVLG